MRSPYVDAEENLTEEEICQNKLLEFNGWLQNGYAVVFQHCRGIGKSTGDCIPYINEREDGLFLQEWIRNQPFYNGELYLCGASYDSSVHFVTAPFADDIKGAVLQVQDCERYNCNYRNRNDEFWKTRFGGGEAHNAIKHAGIPILLVTGFYDIYTGGVFDMWNSLDSKTKSKSALAVHPFDHGCRGSEQPINFENGHIGKEFVDFSFDEHAFVIKKGEKLRIDISSSAFPHYVRHTNNKGLFSEQTTTKTALNTVILDGSFIEIPIQSK